MPWEITFQQTNDEPMNDVATIRKKLEIALPGIQFHVQASGLEKIEAARRIGVEFPEVLRKHFENQPAKTQAIYGSEKLTITIYGFETQPLTKLHAEIRGSENPMDILRSICSLNAWMAIDDGTGATIMLDDATPAQWLEFTGYRDSILSDTGESSGTREGP